MDVEGLVVGPEGVVDVGVPAEVAPDDVVGGAGEEGGRQEEEEAEVDQLGRRHAFRFHSAGGPRLILFYVFFFF